MKPEECLEKSLEEYVDRIKDEYAKQLINHALYSITKVRMFKYIFKLTCSWVDFDWEPACRYKHCIYFSPYLVVREEYKNGKIVNVEKRFR